MARNFRKIRDGINIGSLSSAPSSPQNGDVYYDTVLNSFQRYQNGAWGAFGSGSGSGGVNYMVTSTVDSSSFDVNTGDWVAYADAVGVSPVDGTGGSPTVTITRSASSPLRGTGSGLITKDAANRQGEGISVNFTVDSADEAKLLSVQFDYKLVSGTFNAGSDSTDSDIEVWVYDITNTILIPVTPFKLVSNSSVTPETFKGVFQTNSNSTSYRLILHIPTTNASAWVMKVDNFSVGPQVILNAPSISDWVAYTPTISGFGTATSISFYSRRVGDNLEVKGNFTAGTVAASPAQISIGYNGADGNVVVDTDKIAANTLVGYGAAGNTTLNTIGILAPTSNQNLVAMSSGKDGVSQNPLATANGNQVASSGNNVQVFFSVPIAGWSSNTVTGNDADARAVAFNAHLSTNTGFSANTNIIYDVVSDDTHSAYNASTGDYTVPVSGYYQVFNTFDSATSGVSSILTLDGVQKLILCSIAVGTTVENGSGVIKCIAGQKISVQINGSVTVSGAPAPFITSLSITKVSGPALPLATETVAASYYASPATQSITAGAQINYDTKEIDTHGAVTTGAGWKFTAPISGLYEVQEIGGVMTTASTFQIFKNGSTASFTTTHLTSGVFSGGRQIKLLAGDFIDIRPDTSTTLVGGSPPINSQVHIRRVGNV